MSTSRCRLGAALASGLLALAAGAQNCAGTSIGATPLDDLGGGSYLGFQGGLYPNGQRAAPAGHAAAGLAIARGLQPLDAQGNPDPNGRVVLVSIGMSNTTQEFSTWVAFSNADPNRSPAVVVVDGAQGGQDARRIADPNASFWAVVDQRLQAAGVTPLQVRAAWLKEAVARPTDPFPTHARELRDLLEAIVRNLEARYPNLDLCYLSSRIYAGYATTTLNPEPYAYESGFAVKWLVEDQIGGDPDLNFDPARGAVVAPWLAWGPYLWADGLTPRGDGLIWECRDFAPDGTHPAQPGRDKVAALLDAHFTTDPTTAPWYLGGGGQPRAAVVLYGDGCPAGGPAPRVSGTPFLGNAAFRYGITGAAPNEPAALLPSLARAALPLGGGCVLLVDPTAQLPPIGARTDANGRASAALPVPNDPGLIGLRIASQWLVLDPHGAAFPGLAGIALARGVELLVGLQ